MKETSFNSKDNNFIKPLIIVLVMITIFSFFMGWIKYKISIKEDVLIQMELSFSPFQLSEYAQSISELLSSMRISDIDNLNYGLMNDLETGVKVMKLMSGTLIASYIMFAVSMCMLVKSIKENNALVMCSVGSILVAICSLIYVYIANKLTNSMQTMGIMVSPTIWVYLSIISCLLTACLCIVFIIRNRNVSIEEDIYYDEKPVIDDFYMEDRKFETNYGFKDERNEETHERFKQAGDL